ncbi:pilus assembly protein Flp/PilA [Burkholderia sp. WP9]|uniref:Flp family type IVb pilin n=1 Tax=Burkholderia sp. WP9 TaxID=1500263 RepID=UPI00089B1468|nr:Flp family type IVb pilin [Burkholderia sp. WP9]SEF11105.1 pilus assembly protein Flp/PilA [Burkholderia sp. WP9]
MSKLLKAFVRDERGVSAIEYAILAGIIVVALTAVGTAFNTGVQGLFTTLLSNIKTASNP